MNETAFHPSIIIFIIGCLAVVAILVKAGLERLKLPALVGYILLGFCLRLIDVGFGNILSETMFELFELLAKFGVIVLLFRIGLESNLRGLLSQLRRASFLWIINIIASMGMGYGISHLVLGLGIIPSLFIATALTATSVGIAVGVWYESQTLNSPNGELLVDIAELDDISSIIFMAILFAIVPALNTQGAEADHASLLSVLIKSGGIILLKLFIFTLFCLLFSLYLEKPVTKFFHKIQAPPEPMLLVVSLGIIMGSLAGLLGFSVAIGAFFAGLVFSRDPEAVKTDASFNAVYELLSPFFFIGIGLSLQPDALISGIQPGLVLLVAAVVSKVLGVGVPAIVCTSWTGATLLGISMVPRAEIAMIVMQRGLQEGDWSVTPRIYAAMVLVSAITCLVTPVVVRSLLQKWPQGKEQGVKA